MNLAVCLGLVALMPLAMAGLALIHQGLGRSRSAAHTMLATLCAISVAAIVFVVAGSIWAGNSGAHAHTLLAGGLRWDWLGRERSLAFGSHDGVGVDTLSVLCFETFAACLAVLIPVSSGSDRWRLAAVCGASAVTAALVFPLFAHWMWGGGWLSQLGGNFGLAPFLDAGGAAAVQVLGGFGALSVAWVLGPRRGKYAEGVASAIPGHNIVQVLLGCLLALAGWIGLDGAAAMLFYNASPMQEFWVILNAMLAASAGLLAALLTTRIRYRKPDSSIGANGWVAGLVAGSAGSFFLSPAEGILVGLVAGALAAWLVELFEMKLLVDDPGGAISVHAGAGLWGLLACGLLHPEGGRLLAQLAGIATLLGVMLPLIHICNVLLNRLLPYRVDRDGDWQGMDIRELGAGAYPEFVIHSDEFVPR